MGLRMKPRGLRALLLLPTLTVGSLAAGGLFTQLPVQAAGQKIEICKAGAVTGTFNFTIANARVNIPVSVVAGSCSTTPVTIGNHKITELATAGFSVLSISSFPSGTLVRDNLFAGTATVSVAAGADVIVTYTNQIAPSRLKICKDVAVGSELLVGKPFSFTVTGVAGAFTILAGAPGLPNCHTVATTYASGTNVTVTELQPASNVQVSNIAVTIPPATKVTTSLSARTASLTLGPGVNVVTYTNEIIVTAQKGYVEICKSASDQFVHGSFSFSILDAGGLSYGPFSVTVGQCSGAIQVTSGPATITEASQFPYYLGNVSTAPADRLISDNLSNGTAIVAVVASATGDVSQETVAYFVNDTTFGSVKVCKTVSADVGSSISSLTGDTFVFNYTSSVGINGSVSIMAGLAGQSACVFINPPFGLPLGTTVSITETGQPNVLLTGVSVLPASADAGSTSNTANLTVEAGVVIATFKNEALGTLEVCKLTDNNNVTANFSFMINGTMLINVQAGHCSPPIQVPAGTATILELANPNFTFYYVTATGPSLADNRSLTGYYNNPVTVSVPFGGVTVETIVTFHNNVNFSEFKVCKVNYDGELLNQAFHFTWTATSLLYNYGTQTTDLKPGMCSGIGIYPVQDPAGNPITVNIAETLGAGYSVAAITYQGSGISIPNQMAGTDALTLGPGTNILTYDNEDVDVT
jgi:hypothetical protein